MRLISARYCRNGVATIRGVGCNDPTATDDFNGHAPGGVVVLGRDVERPCSGLRPLVPPSIAHPSELLEVVVGVLQGDGVVARCAGHAVFVGRWLVFGNAGGEQEEE